MTRTPTAQVIAPGARDRRIWRWLAAFGLLAVLATDWLTQLGFAHGVFYIPCVLAAWMTGDRRWLLAVGTLGMAFTVAGMWLSPPAPSEFPWLHVLAHQVVAVALIAATTAFGWVQMGRLGRIEAERERLAALTNALERKDALLEIASTTGQLGGWALDLASGTVRMSDESARIHGQPPGWSPTLDKCLEHLVPEDRAAMHAALDACSRTGQPVDLESRLATRDGRTVWTRTVGRAVLGNGGEIIGIEGAIQDISERKQAGVLLRASQQAFAQLADAMPLIVWTATPDGRLDFFNHALLAHTGATREELAPDVGVDPLIHPDDRDTLRVAWREARHGDTTLAVPVRVRDHRGGHRWHMVQAHATRDEQGRVVRWYGSGADIHEQTELAERAARLARRLSSTLESVTDAFLLVDSQWRVAFVNSRAEAMLERRREDLLNRSLWTEFPAAVGSVFERQYRHAVQSNRPVEFEAPYAPLGKLFLVKAYPSDEGLGIYFQDITARRGAEDQLRLLETAVSRINDIILITEARPIDGDGPRIVYVNDAFERQTGYSRAEILGCTPRVLQGPGTDRAELDRIRSALETWQPVSAQVLNYRKDGAEICLDLEIVPIADGTGHFTHWVSVERDVTERRAVEQQLRQAQRLESVGQLTGGVAHDFNNLLTVILGNAELIPEKAADNPELVGLANMIATAAEKGAEMTRRLLAFARKQPLEPLSVDVNRLLADMDSLLRRVLGEHIEIELTQGGGLWRAQVDPGQLESAVLNLAINARDAMAAGGRLTIDTANVRLDQDYADQHGDLDPGAYVLVAVSDTGCGIPAEQLERVFEPFFTTKSKTGGTGLGLSMVYGFVKQSRGHVAIYSEPGEGTTVRIYLPKSPAGLPEFHRSAERADAGGGSETILLVEDDNLVRRFANQQLTGLGYRVLVASNGPEALALLQSHADIALLFTDVVMPGGMGGRQLAEAARHVRPGLKVLYTSGYTEDAIVHHGRLDPDAQLLSKPYRRRDLARRIREILDDGD